MNKGEGFVSEVVIISGSPSKNSGSDQVLKYLGRLIEEAGLKTRYISVKDVSCEVLFNAKYNSPEIEDISKAIQNAAGIIVASPVYKGAYTGVLKALLDILPQDILKNKPVLPIMTGGSPAHLLAIEYSLKPILATLKGINLKGLYIQDSQIDKTKCENPIIDDELLNRVKKQLYYFIELVNKANAVPIATK